MLNGSPVSVPRERQLTKWKPLRRAAVTSGIVLATLGTVSTSVQAQEAAEAGASPSGPRMSRSTPSGYSSLAFSSFSRTPGSDAWRLGSAGRRTLRDGGHRVEWIPRERSPGAAINQVEAAPSRGRDIWHRASDVGHGLYVRSGTGSSRGGRVNILAKNFVVFGITSIAFWVIG